MLCVASHMQHTLHREQSMREQQQESITLHRLLLFGVCVHFISLAPHMCNHWVYISSAFTSSSFGLSSLSHQLCTCSCRFCWIHHQKMWKFVCLSPSSSFSYTCLYVDVAIIAFWIRTFECYTKKKKLNIILDCIQNIYLYLYIQTYIYTYINACFHPTQWWLPLFPWFIISSKWSR